jgi:hypothetical protein
LNTRLANIENDWFIFLLLEPHTMQEDAAETTIKTFDFSSDIKKFRVWDSKTLTLAKAKGFYAALTTDIGPNITCEEYEFGIVLDKLSGTERLPSLTEICK